MAIRVSGSFSSYLQRTANLPTVTGFTICGWAKLVGGGAGDVPVFGALPNATIYFNFGAVAGGSMVIGSYNGATGNESSFGSRPAQGDWFHWFVRCSGTGANQLEAGWRAVGSSTYTKASTTLIASPSLTALRLGADNYGSFFDGPFQAAKEYDAVLTDDEILNESLVLRPVRFANLRAWAPMVHDATANAVKDFGGNGRDWAGVNTISIEDGPPVGWGAPLGVPRRAAATGYSLTAAAGAFSLSGQIAGLLGGRTLAAAAGALALGGQDAGLHVGRRAQAGAGSFALTGQDADLVQAGAGAYSLAGDVGDFAITGQAAALLAARALVAAKGDFALAGRAAGLLGGWNLSPAAGAFSLGGQPAGLAAGRIVAAAAGAFVATGQSAAFARTYVVAAEPGVFIFSGQPAAFVAPLRGIHAPPLEGVVLTAQALGGLTIEAPALAGAIITAPPL